jgi:hypothetical protein
MFMFSALNIAMLVSGTLLVIMVFQRRRKQTALAEFRKALRGIQRAAHASAMELESERARPGGEHWLEHPAQRYCTPDGVHMVYWVESQEQDVVHHVAASSEDGPQELVVRTLLDAMSALTLHANDVGFQDKIKFRVEAPEALYHRIDFTLTRAQHEVWFEV